MIRPQHGGRKQHDGQCAVKCDRNLKPKLATMRQCTSVTDRRTDRLASWHKREMYSVYITSRAKTDNLNYNYNYSRLTDTKRQTRCVKYDCHVQLLQQIHQTIINHSINPSVAMVFLNVRCNWGEG